MTQYGPEAALIAESFSPRLRYSGASLGYQLASIIAGGPSPFIATWLFATYHSSLPIAIYIAALRDHRHRRDGVADGLHQQGHLGRIRRGLNRAVPLAMEKTPIRSLNEKRCGRYRDGDAGAALPVADN